MKGCSVQGLVQKLHRTPQWYMYGAGIVAYNVWLSLKECFSIQPEKILVSRKNQKALFFDDRVVAEWQEECAYLNQNALMFVVTPEIYHEEIVKQLRDKGFFNYVLIDHYMEYEFAREYYERNKLFLSLETFLEPVSDKRILKECTDLAVYMAQNHKDKMLQKKYDIYPYIVPIQAGAAVTTVNMDALKDDTADNISALNACYCELTVTYWVWKNTHHSYKGICHYRRMFVLPEEQICRLEETGVDVVLPWPYVCRYTTRDQSGRYVGEKDYQALLQAIKQVHPEDYEEAVQIMQGRYLYNYNMLVAKKKVFDDYCEWMFGILKCASFLVNADGQRKDRYAGYFGELLTSIYFMKNQDNYKIVHADRIWMI